MLGYLQIRLLQGREQWQGKARGYASPVTPNHCARFTDTRSNDTGSNNKGSNEKGSNDIGSKVRQRVKRHDKRSK